MKDFTFNCVSPEDWDAYVTTLPEGTWVDEIGWMPFGLLEAPAGTEMDDPQFENAQAVWNVNSRIDDELYPASRIANVSLGNENVIWIDPVTITNPQREWAGGMDYWTAEPEPATTTPKRKSK
jgi:hypothetical protein